MSSESLKKEFDYYRSHQDEITQLYEGKFVIIKDQKIIGVYNSEFEAYEAGQKENELGTFLIQFVSKGTESYTQTFYSRVSV